jgi:Fe2+ or Zn2+ uptake regulation protein
MVMVKMVKRNTMQKKLVEGAVKSMRTHPTAEEVYDYIIARYPEISRATVYRNLKQLSDAGEIRRIEVPGAADRYDLNVSEHYHIQCKICGKFLDIDLPYMTSLDEMVAEATDYDMESHDIVFKGICPGCRVKN